MPARARSEIVIGNRRQLLFDDFFLAIPPSSHPEQLAGNIRWSLGAVQKQPGPIFLGQPPWEDAKQWFCILHDGGIYRLWYNSSVKGNRALRVSYAESQDGLEFKRRQLGVVEWDGSKNNNLVYLGAWKVSIEFGNVFIDPAAPPEQRYKMIGSEWISPRAFQQQHVSTPGLLLGAYSSDGIHWTNYWQTFLGRYSDTQNVATYDPVLEKYVAYIRTGRKYDKLFVGDSPVEGPGRGRCVGRMESESFVHWPDAFEIGREELALAPDLQDGLNVDLYNSAYSRYPGADMAHFMFPSAYHHWEGEFHVQVAVSRDNQRWVRPTRQTFIPLGEKGAFDSFIISVAPGFVPVDRDHYALYYRSGNVPHGGAAVSAPEGTVRIDGMGRVVFKRDRIIGIEASDEPATFSTRPLIFDGRQLLLNVEPTGADPSVRVQLLSAQDHSPVGGCTFDQCVPLTTDELNGVVRWRSGADLGEWAGKPVRLHFQLRAMRIYAFQFVA